MQTGDVAKDASIDLGKLTFKGSADSAEIEIKGAVGFGEGFEPSGDFVVEVDETDITIEFAETPASDIKSSDSNKSPEKPIEPMRVKSENGKYIFKARQKGEQEYRELATLIDIKFAEIPPVLKQQYENVFNGDPETIEKSKHVYFRNFNRHTPKSYSVYPEYWELEAVIRTLTKRRAMRALNAIKTARKIRTTFGQKEKFFEFEKNMLKITNGMRPTQHGFSDGFVKDKDLDRFWGHIQKVSEVFEDLGYQIFINSGTLLGYVRDGKPMHFDDDIDLGIVLKSDTVEAATSEFTRLYEKLLANNMLEEDRSLRSRALGIYKLKDYGKIQVDLFPAWIADDKAYVYPYMAGDMKKDDFLPLRESEIPGIFIPNNPEKTLEVNYGKSWRVPNPYWSFRWGHAQKRFVKFLEGMKAYFEDNSEIEPGADTD